MTTIRLAGEQDVPGIARLYRACYGDDYPFPEFYDTEWIKRGVYDRSIRWFVAADPEGELLGSSAILLNRGDGDDLVSELGRLVVHPDARGRGLATDLVQAITDEAERLSDFAFAECRTAHPGSQIIFDRLGFATLGIEPLAYDLNAPTGHETIVYMGRVSETARALRKPRPTVIPEIYELATHALANVGLEPDVSAEARPAPFPVLRDHADVALEPLAEHQTIRLLRLSRDQFLHPEVFGAMRLEHSHLKLKEHAAEYLVLRRGEAILAGLGFTWDEVERKATLFELVGVDERARGTLVQRALTWLEQDRDPRWIGVDVNAHATRLQQTLHLLGFAPVTYAPSMVYALGERYDVVRMVKLRQEPSLRKWSLIDACERAGRLAEAALFEVARGTRLDAATRHVQVFEGLTDTQVGEIARHCREATYDPGEQVFQEGTEEQALLIVLEGSVDVVRDDDPEPVATIGAGEVFGEMALIEEVPRSAGARARDEARVLVLAPTDFDHLVTADPELGVVVLRNLARTLSYRLRETTAA